MQNLKELDKSRKLKCTCKKKKSKTKIKKINLNQLVKQLLEYILKKLNKFTRHNK